MIEESLDPGVGSQARRGHRIDVAQRHFKPGKNARQLTGTLDRIHHAMLGAR